MRRFRLKVRAAVFVVMLAACTSNDEVTVPIATSSAIVTDAALLRGTLGGLLGTADDGLGSLLTAVSRSVPLSSATSATRTIGSEGGVIRSGGVELRLPRGALAAPVAITLVVPAGPWVEAEFFPHGLKFREPATLRFTTTGTSASGRAAGSSGRTSHSPSCGG